MRAYLFVALLTVATGYAISRGGRDERAVASVLLAAIAATGELSLVSEHWFLRVSFGLLAIDAATWLATIWIAQRSDRAWTLCVASLQGMIVLGHLARLVGPAIDRWVYFGATVLWIYPILLVLLGATFARQHPGALRFWPRFWRRSSARTRSASPRG